MHETLTPSPQPGLKRCAIYTRKSSEFGLEQDFNSLQAQQAICSAYINSQQHKGWTEVQTVYEDAAQSGSTLDRPAIKELLADIERGRIDVVIVYKLDRLSRSLLDFVRLMDVFRRYGVSFACITQNFDTDDSLGRLVMNVLLTFAQFEREMTGDRIRDKRRAMALKGLWSGGRPPIGYDLVKHKLVVNAHEAEIVRFVYEAFLQCGNMIAVARQGAVLGYKSKTYMPRTGILQRGVLLRNGHIRKILMNPIYAGFISSSGKLSLGIHEPIVSRALWDKVAQLRQEQIAQRRKVAPVEVLDEGLMYDCFGRSMSVNRLIKRDRLHVYYRSNQSAWGSRHKVKRMSVSSTEIERLVISGLQSLLCDRERLRSMLLDLGRYGPELRKACHRAPTASRRIDALSRPQLRSVLRALIIRIEVSRERLKIVTRAFEYESLLNWDFVGLFRQRTESTERSPTFLVDLPCAGAIRLERHVRLPIVIRKPQTYRINKSLRKLIADVREAWLLIEQNRHLAPLDIARQRKVGLSYLMRLLRLRYLAPDIITSIMDGAQPQSLTRRTLIDANLPLDWALQRKLFGFPEQPPMRSCDAQY